MVEMDILLKQLAREKRARKESEQIAERKSLELYFYNKQLKELADNLSESEKYLSFIMESAADGLIVLDKSYDIKLSNKATDRLFGFETNELEGKNIINLLPEYLLLNDITDNESNQNLAPQETIGICKDKSLVKLEVSVSKAIFKNENFTIYSIRDITAKKKAEERLRIRHHITQILSEHLPLEETMSKILEIFSKDMQLQEGEFWKLDDNEEYIHCICTWNIDSDEMNEFSTRAKQIRFKTNEGLPGVTWAKKEPCWMNDIGNQPTFLRAALATKAGLYSGFSIPLMSSGKVLGVLVFFMEKSYEFDESFAQMLYDISKHIGIFLEREQSQKDAQSLSRQAGMAEVATSVLHNIGNVLNSVKVSVGFLSDPVLQKDIEKLIMILNMFKENKNNLTHFLIEDEKGKLLLPYIISLADIIRESFHTFQNEVQNLTHFIEHIEEIVALQKTISGVARVIIQKINLTDIIEQAIKICENALVKHKINVNKIYKENLFISTDKSKLLQILVNLIQNAKDALTMSDTSAVQRNIYIESGLVSSEMVYISVTDNGIGITPENITKIFSMGFTTKPHGHGFGLHTSAIAANELKGKLEVYSKGFKQGTTFTLTLPVDAKRE